MTTGIILSMSIFDKVVVFCVVCLSYKVVGSEVTLVNRNVRDSFRVGENGCTNDTSVCGRHEKCQPSGLCLCDVSTPTFRNPNIVVDDDNKYEYGNRSGCVPNVFVRHGVKADTVFCLFDPFQVIPYSHDEPPTQFKYNAGSSTVEECSLKKSWAKFPDNETYTELEWLTESYVDMNITNNTMDFKWKKSVPQLQGAIITLDLQCQRASQCLRAKVFGTWRADSKVNSSNASPVPSNTPTLSGSNTAAESSSNDDGISSTIIAIAVAAPILLLIVLIIVVWLFCRRKKGNSGQGYSSRKSSSKKNSVSAVPPSMRHFNRNDSNLRGLESYTDDPQQRSTGTFDGKTAHSNAAYSTPDIKRIEKNGDLYAVPDKKNKNVQQDINGLNYMDPSALVRDSQETKANNDDEQPTEYAQIIGVLKPKAGK